MSSRTLFCLLLLFFLSGCNASQTQKDKALQDAQATIAALSTANAELVARQLVVTATPGAPLTSTVSAQVAPQITATLAPTTDLPLTTTTLSTSVAVSPSVAVQPNVAAAPASAFPALLHEIPLAAPDQTLIDLRLDRAANRLYVSDSAGHLYVLDATTYAVLATLPVAGALTLDTLHQRLFVAPANRFFQKPPFITIVDTAAMTVTGVISNATHLALDNEHNRIFVGQQFATLDQTGAPGVRILAADSLSTLQESPQGGIPVYNPLRNELLIVAYTVYIADPATGQVTEDLLPELTNQSCRGCVGGQQAVDAYLFPEEKLIGLNVQPIASGGGAGLYPPPRWLNATTLAPVTDLASQPTLQPTCGSQHLIQPAVAGVHYRHEFYARYVLYNNWEMYSSDGVLVTWRDGIEAPFVNAATGQAYANGWVLDLATLNPLGQFAAFCVFDQEADQGLLYAARQNSLVVLADHGGQPIVWANEALPLPAQPINQIVPSPAFATDQTLFVVSGNHALYRSRDGGQQWVHLLQGLPDVADATVKVAISPAFAQDQTLFVGGYIREGRGLGVLRSTDGGEHWQAHWQGLTHLRIYDLLLSPDYATDQRLLALANYTRLTPMETGRSAHLSTDGGLTWSLALTAALDAPLNVQPLLPGLASTVTLPIRLADYGRTIERTVDGGQQWQAVDLHQSVDNRIVAVVAAPTPQAPNIIYILGTYGLWRVRDQGAVVEAWSDSRLTGRTYTNTLSALALTAPDNSGAQQLLIGTTAGELWLLDPAGATWSALGESTSTSSTPPATAPLTATEPLTTPTAPLGNEPPAGLYRPQGLFAPNWEKNGALQQAVGWAQTDQAATTMAAIQSFEQGTMFWLGDTKQIVVLSNDNHWQIFTDTFQEGEPERDPSLKAPGGKLQPIRGFGKIWRDQANVRGLLGWATAKEQGTDAQVQRFEHGLLLRIGGLTYALIEEASGRRVWSVL